MTLPFVMYLTNPKRKADCLLFRKFLDREKNVEPYDCLAAIAEFRG